MSGIINNIKSHLKGDYAASSHPPHSGYTSSYNTSNFPATTGFNSSTQPASSFQNPSFQQSVPLQQNIPVQQDTSFQQNLPLRQNVSYEQAYQQAYQQANKQEEKLERATARAAPLPAHQPLVQPLAHPLPLAQPAPLQSTKTTIEPTVRKNVVEKATIVKETLLPEEKIEIQPVIHREREQTEVHKVVQPLHERDVMATKVVRATLADQVRAPVIENDASYQARSREADTRFASTKEYAALKSQTVQKSAIVEEHIHKTIIEEVQPVLYKETVVPVVIQETQPINERIVEAPTVVNEERAMRDLGTQFATSSVSDQRAFQNMGQGIISPQSFVQTPTSQWSEQQPSNQQWNQTSQMRGQSSDQNQKLYEQTASQKNPLQPNVNSTRLV